MRSVGLGMFLAGGSIVMAVAVARIWWEWGGLDWRLRRLLAFLGLAFLARTTYVIAYAARLKGNSGE